MTFNKDVIEAMAKGEKLELLKKLTPEQAFKLGQLVKDYENQK